MQKKQGIRKNARTPRDVAERLGKKNADYWETRIARVAEKGGKK